MQNQIFSTVIFILISFANLCSCIDKMTTNQHKYFETIDETEPPIPNEKSTTHQTTGSEPSIPSLITGLKMSTKLREPEITEISYTSLKTPKTENLVPTLPQIIHKTSIREPTIQRVIKQFEGITTRVSEPHISEDYNNPKHSTKHETEPKLPNIYTTHTLTMKSEPKVMDVKQDLKSLKTQSEPKIPKMTDISLRTQKPEPLIPTLPQRILKPLTRREPMIPKVSESFNGIKTTISEPQIPDYNNNLKHSTKHSKEPKLPDIYTEHALTMKSEPKIIDVTRTLKTSRTDSEPRIPTDVTKASNTFRTESQPIIPTEYVTQALKTFRTDTEPTIPTEDVTQNMKTSPTESEPIIPTEETIAQNTFVTESEPRIPTEDVTRNLKISRTESEPTIPTEETIAQDTFQTESEPRVPTEDMTPKPSSTYKEPKIPTEINTQAFSMLSSTELNIITELSTPKVTSSAKITSNQTTNITTKTPTTPPQKVSSTLKISTFSITSTRTTEATSTTSVEEYDECIKNICPVGHSCGKDTNYKCECDWRLGYHQIGLNDCQLMSACDSRLNRCGKANCIELRGNTETDYMCVCDDGYILDQSEGVQFCKPVKCDYPLMNKCNQNCINNATHDNNFTFNPEYICKCYDGYKLGNDNKICTKDRSSNCAKDCGNTGFCVNEECICKKWYVWNEANNKCEVDKEWCDQKCNGHCIESNNGVVCNCSAPKYRLNSETGLCDQINLCHNNEVGGKKCSDQRAVCQRTNNDEGFECHCPKGKQMNGGKCIDLCDITDNKVKCDNLNAKCIHDGSDSFNCYCNPGFYWSESDQKCISALFSLKAKLWLRNPVLNERNTFYNSYYHSSISENYFYNNMLIDGSNDQNVIIGNIVKELTTSLKKSSDGKYISDVSLFNCTQTSEQRIDYGCEISIQMNNQNDTIIDQLINDISNCKRIVGNEEKYCFLPPKTLISQKTKPTFNSYEPCKDISNICQKSSYSKCTTIEETTQYECLCPKHGFQVHETRSLGQTINGRDLRLEYCTDVDECAQGKCSGNHKICINTIGSFKCNCDKTYKMNGTQDCIPVCSDVDCGHGVCKESGIDGFWCQCNDGYSGESCTIQANSPSQTAFIISLSVLALVFLLISIIAAFFVGRSKAILHRNYMVRRGDWRAPHFQRSSNIPAANPTVDSRIRESEQ